MAEQILQRFVTPLRRRLTRLYYWSDGPVFRPRQGGRRALVLPRGTVLRTDTWFNAFFENYWRKYTCLSQVSLRLRLSGAGTLRLYRRSDRHEPSLLREITFSGRDQELDIEPMDHQPVSRNYGLLYFEIEAHSASLKVHQTEWVAHTVVTRPIRLAIGICTFNRPSQLLRNITTLLADSDVAGLLERIIIVDQGEEKVRDHADFAALARAAEDRLHLVHQTNRGGAGGFTRCLLEAQDAGCATHVLLMDDDIFPEPESVLRTAAFLSLARNDLVVGGHMLDRSRPNQLVESGSRYRPEAVRIDEPRRHRLDRARDLLPFVEPLDRHYNGWWFLAFPLPVLKRTGLPLPLFLRGDDVEFGCRLLRQGVPTVTLPGVAVWHEPFERKGRGWHAFYELRNYLIVGALHFPLVRAATVARRFFSRLLDELLAYDYYEAWLLCEAVAAYLQGPDVLRRPPLAIHQRLQEMGKILAPKMQEFDGEGQGTLSFPRSAWERKFGRSASRPCRELAVTQSVATVRSHAERGNEEAASFVRVRRWWLVLRNLCRASPDPESRPQVLLHGGGEQWYDVAGADVVGVVEPHRSQMLLLRRSRPRFVQMFVRSIGVALRLLFAHRRTVRRWRMDASMQASWGFWTEYLQLQRSLPQALPHGHVPTNRAATVRERPAERECQGDWCRS